MGIKDEFKAFVMRGNVVDLAIAVVIGGAFGKIVTAFVEGLVMPLIGLVVPSIKWSEWVLGPFAIGRVIGATLDFLIIAFVIFLVLVKGLKALSRRSEELPSAPATKTCPECLESIPAAARRCRHCTSVQA